MTAKDLQKQFEEETGTHWKNSQGEPDIDYVAWLEAKVISTPAENVVQQKNPEWLTQNVISKAKEIWSVKNQPKMDSIKYLMTVADNNGCKIGVKKAKEIFDEHCNK